MKEKYFGQVILKLYVLVYANPRSFNSTLDFLDPNSEVGTASSEFRRWQMKKKVLDEREENSLSISKILVVSPPPLLNSALDPALITALSVFSLMKKLSVFKC